MVTKITSFSCHEDTNSVPGQVPSEGAYELVSYKKKKGQSMAIILSGNKQEVGQADRVSIPESPQRNIHGDYLTVFFVETNNFGWQTWSNLCQAPDNTRKSQQSCSPALGGVCRKSFTCISPSTPRDRCPG